MVSIISSLDVKRGEKFSAEVVFTQEELEKARGMAISLENRIKSPNPCRENLSDWSYPAAYSPEDARRSGGKVKFECAVERDAPPSYSGRLIECAWFLKVKVDIPMARDVNEERLVMVRR